MTLRYLLDTSVVSAPIAKIPSPQVLRKLQLLADQCAIASPVWHELQYGWLRMPAGKRKMLLQDYLQDVVRASFPILSYDEAACARHAFERARLESVGRPAPFVDGQIAAIAQVNGLTLVTRNTRDFSRFEELQLENWEAP